MSQYIKVFAPDSTEYQRLTDAAAYMCALSPNHWYYSASNTCFDWGRGLSWTTVICRRDDGAEYMALTPADQERILTAPDEDGMKAAVKEILGRSLDKSERHIVTYSPSGSSDLVTYWGVMARDEADAMSKFRRKFPGAIPRTVEKADPAKRDMYGLGWYTDDERAEINARLQANYDAVREAKPDAETEVQTYEPDELEAHIAYKNLRESGRTQNLDGVYLGDIFYVQWGYEQTNYTFFQVVGLRGKHTVVLRENAQRRAGLPDMSGLSRPVRNAFANDQRVTKKSRIDDKTGELWISAPEEYGGYQSLRLCKFGQLFTYTSYA